MNHYKLIIDGYIAAIGTGTMGIPITAEEYDAIRSVLRNAPTAPDGFAYRLTDWLEWELYELPIVNEADEEISGDELLSMLEGVL